MTERKDIGGHEPDIEVVDYLYGEMTPEHRAAFERRLQEDSTLRVEVARLQMLKTRLDGLPGIEPPPDLVDRVLAEAHAACRKREQQEIGWLDRLAESFRWLLRPQAGIALAAMLVVAVGIYMAREAKQPSKPGTPDQAREQMRPLPAKSAQEDPEAAPVKPGMAEGKAEGGKADEGIGAAGKLPSAPLGLGAEGGDGKPAAPDGSGKTGGTRVGDWQKTGVRSPDEPSGQEAEAMPSAEAAGKPATAESPADNGEGQPVAAPAATTGRMTGLEPAKGEGGEAAAKPVRLDGEDGVTRDPPLAANLSGTRELDKKLEANADVQLLKEKQAETEDRAEKEEGVKARVKKEAWFADDNGAAAPAEPAVVEKRPAATMGDLRGAKEPAAVEGERSRPEAKSTTVEGPARDSKGIGDAARTQDVGSGGVGPYKPAQMADASKPAEEASPTPVAEVSADVSLPVGVAAGGATQPGAGEPGQASPVLVENRYEESKKKAEGKDAAATAGPVKVDLARDSGLLSLLLGKNVEKAEEVNATQESAKAEKKAEAPVMKDEEKVQAEQAGAMPVALDVQTKAAAEEDLGVAKKDGEAREKVDCAATWNKLLALEKAGKNADALSLLDEFRTGACAGYVSAETIGFKEADLYLASGQKDRARKVLNRLKMASPPAEQKAMDMLESIEK